MLITLLYPFIILSAIGLILSVLAHIASLLGLSVPPPTSILQTGIFVVFIPAVVVMKSFIPQRKDNWRLKVALRSAPKWMRYMTYGFVGYAVVSFILFLFIAPSQTSTLVEDTSGSMAFYSASFVMLYSALQNYKKGVMYKCPNGHKVHLSAEHCDKCGERIQDLNEPW